MNKVYVPIGCNCFPSIQLNKIGRRVESYPLDWLCVYHSVYRLFENNFDGFLNTTYHKSERNSELFIPTDTALEYSMKYATRIFHRDYEGDKYNETINRRIIRLLELLKSQSTEIVFIRRGHLVEHHHEVECGPLERIENSLGEVDDMKRCVDVLKRKYPNLKFKIHLFITCNCRNDVDFDSEFLRVKVIPQESSDDLKFRTELEKL